MRKQIRNYFAQRVIIANFCNVKMTNSEKLLALIECFAQGNKSEFGRMIGLSPSGINGWLTRGNVNYGIILQKLPTVSREWLLNSKGDMLCDPSTNIIDDTNIVEIKPQKGPFSVKANLEAFIAYEGLCNKRFEEMCGLGNGFVSKVGETIRAESINLISKAFPNLNTDWLVHGRGDMINLRIEGRKGEFMYPSTEEKEKNKPEPNVIATMAKPTAETNAKGLPRITSMAVAAGALSQSTGCATKENVEYLPVLRGVPTYDYTIIVQGNSMIPHFQSGDEVAIRKVTASYLEWGKPYVVVTKNDGVVLKRIYDKGENLRMVSYNMLEYPDFDIPKSEILAIYKVVGLLRVGF